MNQALARPTGLVCPLEMFTDGLPLLLGSLAIVLFLAAGVILNLASRRATRVLEDVDVSDGLIDSYVGGLRWPLPAGLGTTNMPPVLVGLELYPWGLRIGARWSFLYPFMPVWYARYDELLVAEHAKRGLRISKRASDGVRLRAHVAGAPVIFWTSNWSGLLDTLEAQGVTVVRRATPTGAWSND